MVARRSVRKRVSEALVISNAMTGESLGRIGNLSVDGMMLITSHELPDGCLFQVQFQLHDVQHHAHRMEVGIQCLWSEAARTENSYWIGCKIIDISHREQEILDTWVERAAETV
ncbi:MAG: PilZ domain-containing protein [Xanthomonadales bacterium]|nr:PilZ domain-containing protein [Xanthomonadales bacterium]